MSLDVETCYRAFVSRDRRFDGRFYAGVVTTGVYCRPGCPAPPPKPKNVRFFACAAAAEEAGFRACFRCRPDRSPGTPAWLGTSATVSRALRLIAHGALDDAGVDELAARLGVGSRHLRRLFARHLGASPLAIAQRRRIHFARKLLEETTLPVAEIAHASGFASIRRFNAAIRAAFDRTPRQLREHAAVAEGGITLELPFRPPLDWDGLLGFLAARAIPGVESVENGTWRRTTAEGGLVEASLLGSVVRLRLDVPVGANLIELSERVRRVLDLGADPHVIAEHLGHDGWLAQKLSARPGVRVPGAWDPFELAVRAVLGQQVSVRAAQTLAGRLVRTFGRPLATPRGALTHVFPTPRELAGVDARSIGLTGARAATLRRLAEHIRDRRVVLDGSAELEQVIAQLTAIAGIGEWTAQYIAMRALGEPDAFPAGDLGLRKALGNGAGPVAPKLLASRAEAWRPWRAYAAMLLWEVP